MILKMKIRKGDEVIVITGKDKGKRGTVLAVMPKLSRIVVSGINIVVKHVKPSKVSEGGIVRKESSIHVSNVAHIDPTDGKPTKIRFKVLSTSEKVRIAKRSGSQINTERQ